MGVSVELNREAAGCAQKTEAGIMVQRLASARVSVICLLLTQISVAAGDVKYQDRPIDVMVANGASAREYMLDGDAILRAETHIVFGFVEQSTTARI